MIRNLPFADSLCRVVLALIVAATASVANSAELADLVARLPDDANALIVIDAESMFAGPLAKRDQWREKYASAFEATPLVLPPSAKLGVLAAEFDVTSMQPLWEAAVMVLNTAPSIDQVAQKTGGVKDRIVGYDAVWTPTKACILRFAPSQFGVIFPVSRQVVARWADQVAHNETADLADYLLDAANVVESGEAQIAMAIDLQNTLREQDVDQAVQQAAIFQDLPRDQVAEVLSSIVGIRLEVRIDEKVNGEITIDFGDEASVLQPVAKQLALSIMSGAGAMLEEFNNWSAETDKHSISIAGELSVDGMRRMLSLLSLNAGIVDQPAEESPAASAPGSDEKEARMSLRYFRGVAKYVDDLNRLRRAQSIDQAALWVENYARKIDRLSTSHVDPQLIQYGQSVADRFRQVVDAAHAAYAQADETVDQLPGGKVTVGYLPTARRINWGGYVSREYAQYGKVEYDVGEAQRQQKAARQEIQQGMDAAVSIMQGVVSDTAQMRETMSQRYGVKF